MFHVLTAAMSHEICLGGKLFWVIGLLKKLDELDEVAMWTVSQDEYFLERPSNLINTSRTKF
jgi:hypothetical protein